MAIPHNRWWLGFFPLLSAVALLAIPTLLWMKSPSDPGQQKSLQVSRKDQLPPIVEAGLKPKPRPAEPTSTVLAIGQKAATQAGEKRRLMLPDGSTLYLNERTSIELPQDRQLKLTAGEVFVEAIEANAERGSFTVSTPSKSLTALGTRFAVRADDHGTGILVTQGKVEVSGLETAIAAGQELAPGTTDIRAAVRASHALDWTRELQSAGDSPLIPGSKYDGGALIAVDPYGQEAKLALVKYHIDVHVEDGFARTTIDQTYFNRENSQMEGTFYFPLPPDASISRLAMYVSSGAESTLMEGGMAERDIARQTYERVRYANRDPALLEWVDGSLFKMRVFPLEARQEKRIVLSYSQKLPVSYGRTSYRFPAGHSLNVVRDWSFSAFIKDGAKLSASSPSHPDMKVGQRGSDLVLTDRKTDIKADKDVVLDLNESNPKATPSVRWSAAEQDGHKYLMLRDRPQLPGALRRERRDWVILFESAGTRDPLVARTQIEILRNLFKHAEHDDTFALMTVGTRIHRFTAQPLPVSTDNLAAAMKFLEQTHLIGALDLERALKAAGPWLTSGQNSHLVHIGGGVATLGEQRTDKLLALLPQGTRYVGIGVGKRVSPAFMKVAAEKTGGLFTQINPDEPIAWRSFELASTLNTPRLLNITVDAGVHMPRFLTFTNTLAHGEELAAVARIDDAVLNAVTVRGTVDGQTFEQVVPIQQIAPKAEYLPRIWAKLEIDRLMAEDILKHRQTITELSKAMYVMTPFTSLLVLENEAMYLEFKIDRGRADHWAMYGCPAKMPTVYIPDPNQPAGNGPGFTAQKPHRNQVMQSILCRTMPRYMILPNTAVAGDEAVQTAGKFFGGADRLERFETRYSFCLGYFGGESDSPTADHLERMNWNQIEVEKYTGSKDRQAFYMTHDPTDSEAVKTAKQEMMRLMFRKNVVIGDSEYMDSPPTNPVDSWTRLQNITISNTVAGEPPEINKSSYGLAVPPFGGYDAPRRSSGTGLIGTGRTPWDGNATAAELRNAQKETFRFWMNQEPSSLSYDRLNGAISDRFPYVTGGTVSSLGTFSPQLPPRPQAKEPLHLKPEISLVSDILDGRSHEPSYYGRPRFSNVDRVFTDLVAYAPGMSSSPADVQAALEAEAAPRLNSRRGTLDPSAKTMIERARTSEWRTTTLPVGKGAAITIAHDGQGRFAYERQLPFGLKEHVYCDGLTLLHLYPELGIGARRAVSRFHRADLVGMIRDLLPPAADLSVGADVVVVDPRTVAIVPLDPSEPGEEVKPQEWIEIHLIFEGNRLAERRLVLLRDKNLAAPVDPSSKKDEMKPDPVPRSPRAKKSQSAGAVFLREVYEAGGMVKILDAQGKELVAHKFDRKPAPPANLTPDLNDLVVLPLPLRSRDIVFPKHALNPGRDLTQEDNGCFEYLDEPAALELLAASFAENHVINVVMIWQKCFYDRGDRRERGFYTLMASTGINAGNFSSLMELASANPSDPLLRYLFLYNDRFRFCQAHLGIYPGPRTPDDFLNNLFTFRALSIRWQSDSVVDSILGSRESERKRALAFVKHHAGNEWGWCVLAMLSDQAQTNEFRKEAANAWGLLAEKSGLNYHARYEQARQLRNAGAAEDARTRFTKLFEETLAKGRLPLLDETFRNALEHDKSPAWAVLMRTSVAAAIEKRDRQRAVLLAWQSRQLGDHPLADRLLRTALADLKPEEKPIATIAAIEYLMKIGDYRRADTLLTGLLDDPSLAQAPAAWRLAAQIAQKRNETIRQYSCLEKALDREFATMPAVFDISSVRSDYNELLGHYQWLAEASVTLKVPAPADLASRTIRYADRWRSLDPDATEACDLAAKILTKLGGEGASSLAWDYLTTPLGLKSNESGPWLRLAESAKSEGNLALADRCYREAFSSEPTNAQILWDRAQLLQSRGNEAEARKLMQQILQGDWQDRFNGVKIQAREVIEGR